MNPIIQYDLERQEKQSIKDIVVNQCYGSNELGLPFKKVYVNGILIKGITDIMVKSKDFSNEVTLVFDCPNVSFRQDKSLADEIARRLKKD